MAQEYARSIARTSVAQLASHAGYERVQVRSPSYTQLTSPAVKHAILDLTALNDHWVAYDMMIDGQQRYLLLLQLRILPFAQIFLAHM